MKADIDLLKRLVRIPSVSADAAANDRVADEVARWLGERGVATTFERGCDGRKILYASTRPGKVQDFLFNAHTDVVPAPPQMFEPVERDGWLCGRGCGDCKGNVVLICRLLAELNGRASVGAVFSADEECGGQTAEAMIEKGYGARKLVAVMDSQPYKLCIAEKGHTYFTLVARGMSGHSSRPWECDNAVDRLLSGWAKLQPILPHEATAEDLWHDTIVATVLQAGDVANRVPDVARMTLNLRYVEPDGADTWERKIRETTGLEVVRGENSPPVVTDGSAPIVMALQKHLRRAWPGRPVPLVRMNGATDARMFVKLGVSLVISCAEKRGDHADGEGVRIASIDEVADAFRDFIQAREG